MIYINLIELIQFQKWNELKQVINTQNWVLNWKSKKSFRLGGRKFDWHNIEVKESDNLMDVIIRNTFNLCDIPGEVIEILQTLIQKGMKTSLIKDVLHTIFRESYDHKYDEKIYGVFFALDKEKFVKELYDNIVQYNLTKENFIRSLQEFKNNNITINFMMVLNFVDRKKFSDEELLILLPEKKEDIQKAIKMNLDTEKTSKRVKMTL